MGRSRLGVGVLGMLGVLAHPVWAQMSDPIVLYDSGRTYPLAPFFARVNTTVEPPPKVNKTLPAHGLRLPIVTERMSVGTVTARRLTRIHPNMPRSALRPLFLFGADARSLQWVRDNRQRLKVVRAVGMLVAATTDHEVEAAQQAVGDIPMLGGSADDMARALKLQHYPVLITPEGISQ